MIYRPEWYSEEEWQEAKSNAAKEPRPAEGNARKARGNGAGAVKEKGEKRTPQANKLIALSAEAKLFHTADGNCYADLDINGHRETWPVRSKGFRRWLTRRYFEEEDGAANDAAVSTALGMIEAHAHFNSPERKVHVRVGGMDGKLYLDLCNADWRAIEIDAAGWRVIPLPPVRFRRSAGMQPLPMPLPGGTVGTLKSFLNVKSDEDFVLTVAGFLRHSAITVLTRSLPLPANTDRPRVRFRQYSGYCATRTPRRCVRYRARTATYSLPRLMGTCCLSITFLVCQHGSATRSAAWQPVAALQRVRSTVIKTKRFSIPAGQ